MFAASEEPEDLVAEMDSDNAAMCAASSRMLRKIASFDEQKRWERDGATSMTAWLCAKYGWTFGIAREWVRVARVIGAFPRLAEAHAKGLLSFEQLRPLTFFCDNDEWWAKKARHMSCADLWLEKKRREALDDEHLEDDTKLRSMEAAWDSDERFLRVQISLPREQGIRFLQAIEQRARDMVLEPGVFLDPEGARMCDALIELLCSSGGAGISDVLVVHVDAAVLAGVPAGERPHLGESESGERMGEEQIRRLACDSRIEWVMERRGRPVGVGRTSRTPPPAMTRRLRFRDRGCRFPGCGRTGWLKRHHIHHWIRGGRTDDDNMVLLCHAHHRLVHEGRWGITGRPDGDMWFVDTSGGKHLARPPNLARPAA